VVRRGLVGADKYLLCLDLFFVTYKEHHSYIYLYQPEKSAMAEYSVSMGHCINCSGTYGCLDSIVKETVECMRTKIVVTETLVLY